MAFGLVVRPLGRLLGKLDSSGNGFKFFEACQGQETEDMEQWPASKFYVDEKSAAGNKDSHCQWDWCIAWEFVDNEGIEIGNRYKVKINYIVAISCLAQW